MERSHFSTATLKALPVRAYAYRARSGAWYLRQDGATYSEATPSEADLIKLANDIANENDWRRQSRGGDAQRDYDGE